MSVCFSRPSLSPAIIVNDVFLLFQTMANLTRFVIIIPKTLMGRVHLVPRRCIFFASRNNLIFSFFLFVALQRQNYVIFVSFLCVPFIVESRQMQLKFISSSSNTRHNASDALQRHYIRAQARFIQFSFCSVHSSIRWST